MEVAYTEKAQEHLLFWKMSGNKKVQKKIAGLIEEIRISPKEGRGKPEQLKYDLTGKWSRRITGSVSNRGLNGQCLHLNAVPCLIHYRITEEDRLIYSIEENLIVVHALKGHYE